MLKKISLALVLILFSCASFGSYVPKRNKVEYVAGVIYTEALGQSDYAKGLVATTIWMRAGGDPDRIHEVCTIPKQFARSQKNDDDEWESCLLYAKTMFNGTFNPLSIQHPSGDWIHPDHFLTTKLMRSKYCPSWAKGKWHKRVDDLSFLMLGKFRVTKEE